MKNSGTEAAKESKGVCFHGCPAAEGKGSQSSYPGAGTLNLPVTQLVALQQSLHLLAPPFPLL